jgi:hypothetical protein
LAETRLKLDAAQVKHRCRNRIVAMKLSQEVIMTMPESSETNKIVVEQSAGEVAIRIDKAGKRAANFIIGAQKLMLEESMFVGKDMLERAQTETNLFSEFISETAGAHCIKDIRTMYKKCAKHQIEFVRRDCNRLFKNGEHVIEASSNLFKSHPLN